MNINEAINHRLLAVVEVGKVDRVICQAENCGRHVFKRIHVVLDTGKVRVLGQQCYSNIYLEGSGSDNNYSHYTGNESRKLTPEEIDLLVNNTEWLIAQFENELNMRAEQERNLRQERERLQNIESESRLREQAAKDAAVKNLVLRDVKCHYCRMPMTTRAKSMPAVGYKCQPCIENNRSMPTHSRMGVTAEANARDNEIAAKQLHKSSQDYKNIRG